MQREGKINRNRKREVRKIRERAEEGGRKSEKKKKHAKRKENIIFHRFSLLGMQIASKTRLFGSSSRYILLYN